MTALDELVAYHAEMAYVASAAANGAGMAKGHGLHAQAERHERWVTFLRNLQPPTPATVPKLRCMRGGET